MINARQTTSINGRRISNDLDLYDRHLQKTEYKDVPNVNLKKAKYICGELGILRNQLKYNLLAEHIFHKYRNKYSEAVLKKASVKYVYIGGVKVIKIEGINFLEQRRVIWEIKDAKTNSEEKTDG